MKSIRQVYKIGLGPSSSHTMGPEKAAKHFAALCPDAESFQVTLYGSLAKTGKGHKTDEAITNALAPKKTEIIFDKITEGLPHQNTMDFVGLSNEKTMLKKRYFSIGGGDILVEGETAEPDTDKIGNTAKKLTSYRFICNIYPVRIDFDKVSISKNNQIKFRFHAFSA